MPYDWTRGYCKDCGKFVRDGQGIQEQIKGNISRFCEKCFLKRCNPKEMAGTAPASEKT